MSGVTIAELIRNGTMSADMAAVLWAAVDQQLSFLTVALPRLAGKSTTSLAALALRPPEMPAFRVAGEPSVMERLKQERHGGYLVVDEFSHAPMPGYIWGEPVRRVFDALDAGYALQTSLHASDVEEGILQVTRGNGISDEQASTFKLVVFIERFGNTYQSLWRRVTELYEVHAVENGRPVGHPLYRWRQHDDSFEKLTDPHQFGREPGDLADRARLLSVLAESGKTSAEAVAEALAGFRATRAGNAED